MKIKKEKNNVNKQIGFLDFLFFGFFNKKGFTVVELLIVVALIIIMAVLAVPVYSNFQSTTQLNDETIQLVQTLRVARQRSLAGLNSYNHGVKLENDNYILYQGVSYQLRDGLYDRKIKLNNSLNLVWQLGNNLDDINFTSNGVANTTGTISINHAINGTFTINLNSLGLVEKD